MKILKFNIYFTQFLEPTHYEQEKRYIKIYVLDETSMWPGKHGKNGMDRRNKGYN